MTDYRIAALCETREARELFALIASEAKAERPRAIAASGLPVPLLPLLVREGCRVLAPDHPAVVFVGDGATAARIAGELQADGLRAAAYLPREYVLYHVTASRFRYGCELVRQIGRKTGQIARTNFGTE